MAVYFLQAGNRIKIGHAKSVSQRMLFYKTHNHENLRLLAVIEGSRPLEASLHKRFQNDRVQGEWFRSSPELLQYIGTLPLSSSLVSTGRGADHRTLKCAVGFLRVNERDVMHVTMLSEVFRDYLLKVAELYRVAEGLAMPTISNKFYGNAKFFDQYRAGECSISIDRYEAVVEKFKANWPKGLYFPKFPKIRVVVAGRGKVKKITG
jgi:hypothetical protein